MPFSLTGWIVNSVQGFRTRIMRFVNRFRPGVYLVSVAKILDAFAYTSAATESEKTSAAALRRLLDLQPEAKIGNFVWYTI